jgi:hypothetical protein
MPKSLVVGVVAGFAAALAGCVTEPNFDVVAQRTAHKPLSATYLVTHVRFLDDTGEEVEHLETAESIANLEADLTDVEDLLACASVWAAVPDVDDCEPGPFKFCVENDNKTFAPLSREVCMPVVLRANGSFELTTGIDPSTGLEVTLAMYPK